MHLERRACYRVLLARDARYDGRFFTCVKTTGIYCRPICPARTPKLENCLFVPSAAAAQEAGYRPCLRCRPERSPEILARQGSSATVSRALALIERGALDEGDVEALAARLGLGPRQLRRLFQRHVGASPIAVAQTRRLLLAKQLIHDSALSMTEVALASGFASLRRFNETFKQLYGRPPSALRVSRLKRAQRERSKPRGGAGPGRLGRLGGEGPCPPRLTQRARDLTLFLPYRKPYDFTRLLAFLAGRAIAGVERVTSTHYARVIELGGAPGSFSVSDCPERGALRIEARLPRLEALPALIARVRQLFDLGCDPQTIARELGSDAWLGPLLAARPGLRVPGAWEGFEIAVRGILGQQITVRAATRLAGTLVERIGMPLPSALCEPGLTHAFPAPERFTSAALTNMPMPRARAEALLALAEAARNDARLFDPGRELAQVVARLVELPGIGSWTAQYIALRALAERDAFPSGDIGLLRALAENGVRPSPKQLLARAEAWRPWRAYAVLHLWTFDAERAADAARAQGKSQEAIDALAS